MLRMPIDSNHSREPHVAIRHTLVAMTVVFVALTIVVTLSLSRIARAQGQPLFNETFETGFNNDPYCTAGDCKVPQGWGVWFIPRTENDPPGINAQPKYDSIGVPNRVKTGQFAQRIWTDNATHTGGIYRVVRDVPVGAKLRFTVWGQVWSTNDESPISARPSRDIRLKIGLDPLGGNNGNPSPLNGQVVWSAEQSPADGYVQFSVEVEARASTVIVYTYSTMRDNVRHNDVFWDDAILETIAPPPTATPAAITETSPITTSVEATITPTEAAPAVIASPAVTYVVKSGDTLFGIALDQGTTLEEILRLNPGVRAETLQIGQVLTIKEAVAAPTPTPGAGGVATASIDPNVSITASQEITATPTVGKICVAAFFDDNGSGKRDETEDLVPNILFAVTAAGQQLGTYTTNGVEEPYCFSDLPNGSYTVAATALDIYAPTSPLNDTINVNGARSIFYLGLRRVTDGSTDVSRPAQPEQSSGPAINLRALLPIAGGTLLLVGVIGFAASLFLRRRRL
jgi:LysM repeat protein